MKNILIMMGFPLRLSGVFCCLLIMTIEPSCYSDSYWVKLSGSQTISVQWIELQPRQPQKPEKDVQYIVLALEPPFRDDIRREGNGPDKGLGILMPDGEVINPEIEIADQDGKADRLVYAGSTGAFLNQDTKYALPNGEEFPRDRVYKSLRVRSPRAIKVKA